MATPNKLYLLMHASGQSFKIGIAVTPYKRASVLPDDIDFSRSLESAVPNGSAKSVESILHYLCRDLSLTAARVAAGEKGEGYTEWFHIDGLDRVKNILETHKALLGIESLRPLMMPKPQDRPPRGRDEDDAQARRISNLAASAQRQDKAQRKQEQLNDWEARAKAHNLKVIQKLSQWIDKLRAADALVGLSVEPSELGGPGTYLYLRGPQADQFSEEMTHPDEKLHLARVGGGGWRIFEGAMGSDAVDLVEVAVVSSLVLDDRRGRLANVPCHAEVSAILRDLIPPATSEAATAMQAAHKALRVAWRAAGDRALEYLN